MKALLTVHNFMLRKLIILFLALTLSWTNIAYARAEETTPSARNVVNTLAAASTQLSDNGQYPVQQVTYDDTTGEYSLVLLNTSPGTPPVFRVVLQKLSWFGRNSICTYCPQPPTPDP